MCLRVKAFRIYKKIGCEYTMRASERIEFIEKEIDYITGKIEVILSQETLNIHEMSDLHRYAETRLFLVRTRNELVSYGDC